MEMIMKKAVKPASIPLQILCTRNGFWINPDVAPTSCILRIINLLEKIANRIVLFIRATAIRSRIPLKISRNKLIFLKFACISATILGCHITCLTAGFFSISAQRIFKLSVSVYAGFTFKSTEAGKGFCPIKSRNSSFSSRCNSSAAYSLVMLLVLLV